MHCLGNFIDKRGHFVHAKLYPLGAQVRCRQLKRRVAKLPPEGLDGYGMIAEIPLRLDLPLVDVKPLGLRLASQKQVVETYEVEMHRGQPLDSRIACSLVFHPPAHLGHSRAQPLVDRRVGRLVETVLAQAIHLTPLAMRPHCSRVVIGIERKHPCVYSRTLEATGCLHPLGNLLRAVADVEISDTGFVERLDPPLN